MLLRTGFLSVLALVAALPSSAHGLGHAMSGGKPGEAGKVTRVIEVVATDNAFSMDALQVKEGETVRFVVRNDGLDPHEFLIGTAHEHVEHQQMMREMAKQQKRGEHAHSMAMMEAHESGVSVDPGKTETFVWTFTRTTNLEFACDIPGHYKDGMHGLIIFSH